MEVSEQLAESGCLFKQVNDCATQVAAIMSKGLVCSSYLPQSRATETCLLSYVPRQRWDERKQSCDFGFIRVLGFYYSGSGFIKYPMRMLLLTAGARHAETL